MIMWTSSGLRYPHPSGGKFTVPLPLSGTRHGLGGGGGTVTWNEQEALWPQLSLAPQFTIVVPSGKVDPDGGLQNTAIGVQIPAAVAV
jgi:hypothetical protein